MPHFSIISKIRYKLIKYGVEIAYFILRRFILQNFVKHGLLYHFFSQFLCENQQRTKVKNHLQKISILKIQSQKFRFCRKIENLKFYKTFHTHIHIRTKINIKLKKPTDLCTFLKIKDYNRNKEFFSRNSTQK